MGRSKKYDIAFEEYLGTRRYTVSHPEHSGTLLVAAPTEVAAMVAAAKKWGVRWQRYEYYAFCEVKMFKRKGEDA